jgi:hypothetical protein
MTEDEFLDLLTDTCKKYSKSQGWANFPSRGDVMVVLKALDILGEAIKIWSQKTTKTS